jgi:hypothetical protein
MLLFWNKDLQVTSPTNARIWQDAASVEVYLGITPGIVQLRHHPIRYFFSWDCTEDSGSVVMNILILQKKRRWEQIYTSDFTLVVSDSPLPEPGITGWL